MLRRQRKHTVDRDVCAACHSECTVSGRSCSCFVHRLRCISINCVCRIKRYEQRDALGDYVVACRQCAVIHKNNGFVACICGVGCSRIEVGIKIFIAVCGKICRRVFARENRFDRHCRCRLERVGCVDRKNSVIKGINPGNKFCFARRCCNKSCTVCKSDIL